MPIEFNCTQCSRLLRTPDNSAGKQAKCPECGTILIVPPQSTAVSPPPPPAAPVVESGNPYQAPPTAAPQSPPPVYYPPTPGKASPASRVAGPAVAMMVTGGLGMACSLFLIVFFAWAFANAEQFNNNNNAQGPDEMRAAAVFYMVWGSVSFLVDCVIVFGAIQMKNLSSFGWAMTSAVISVVPCLTPCCPVSMGFGIWAIVVLQDNDVRQAFAMTNRYGG